MYLIKKVSKISGVSVRTLHHYDEIRLLSPEKYENGYRYYSEDDLSKLQAILFYKYLGFSLKQIKELLAEEESEILPHLRKQLTLMQNEKQRLLTLIDTLKKTIKSREREITMDTKEKFKGFTYHDSGKYRQAVIDKYGKEVMEESEKRQKGNEKVITDGFNEIFFAFAGNMGKGLKASDKENVELAEKLHKHLCEYSFDCSLEVFESIGKGYVQNPEFKKNLDKFGEGTAEYVCESVQRYVNGN